MDTTVIIGYAGGYCEIRINTCDQKEFTLEFFVAEEKAMRGERNWKHVPDESKPTQTFKTSKECWEAVGKIVGWINKTQYDELH